MDRELEGGEGNSRRAMRVVALPGARGPHGGGAVHETELEAAAMQAAEAQGGTHACLGSPDGSSPASTETPASQPAQQLPRRARPPAMPRQCAAPSVTPPLRHGGSAPPLSAPPSLSATTRRPWHSSSPTASSEHALPHGS
jgi:hypothetical protein